MALSSTDYRETVLLIEPDNLAQSKTQQILDAIQKDIDNLGL